MAFSPREVSRNDNNPLQYADLQHGVPPDGQQVRGEDFAFVRERVELLFGDRSLGWINEEVLRNRHAALQIQNFGGGGEGFAVAGEREEAFGDGDLPGYEPPVPPPAYSVK